MRNWISKITTTAAMLLASGIAQAATLNVPTNYATIQAAIDAASPGDVIEVAAGTYAPAGNLLTINKSLTLKGAKYNVDPTVSANGRATLTYTGESVIVGTILVDQDVTDVTIDGFYFDYDGSAIFGEKTPLFLYNRVSDITMSNNVFEGQDYDGSVATLTDFWDNGGAGPLYAHGIVTTYGTGATNVTVTKNVFEGWYGSTYINSATINTVITDNNVDNNINAFRIDGGNGVTITGNTIDHSAGLDLMAWGGSITSLTIQNNSFSNYPAAFGAAFGYIKNRDPLKTIDLVGQGNVFDGKTIANMTYPDDFFALESNLRHAIDRSDYGFINIMDGNVFVNPPVPDSDLGIQQGIAIASTGDTVNVADGTYVLPGTLNILKPLIMSGESEAGVIIDASGNGAGYGILVEADDVTLQNFTLLPPATGTPPTAGGYAIHASYNHGVTPYAPYANLALSNITIENGYRTSFDIHGYDGVTLANLTARNNNHGNGIQITGCTDVTVTGCTVESNAWGGIAVYCSGSSYLNRASSNVSIDYAANSVSQPIYVEDEFGLANTDITIAGSSYLIDNDYNSGTASMHMYTDGSQADAVAIANGLNGKYSNTASTLQNTQTGAVVVFPGHTIQAAIDAAVSGDTIEVAAGTYVEALNIAKPLTLLGATAGINKNGYTIPAGYAWDDTVETIIMHPDPTAGYDSIVNIEDTDDVTLDGFVIQETAAVGNKNTSLVRVYANTHEISNISVINNVIGPNTSVASQDGAQGRMGLYIVNNPYDDKGVVNSSFSGNKIFDCQGNGNNVFIWSSYFAYGAPGPASMHGTVIEDNEICGAHRSGLESAGGYSDLTIRNNKIHGNASTVVGLPYDAELKYGHGILLIRGASDKLADSAHAYGPTDLTIEDNEIYENGKSGIYMGPMNKNYQITGNSIHDNGWNGILLDLEARHWNGTFETPPVPQDKYAVYDGSTNIVARDNAIFDNGDGDDYGIQVNGTPSNGFVFDASANYWGAADGPSGTAPGSGDAISEDVGYDPYYADAALTQLQSLEVFVDDDFDAATPGWGTNAFATVQEGVAATAPGGVLNVAEGTYAEQVEIAKDIDVVGAGTGLTVITGINNMPLSFSVSGGPDNKPIVYIHDTDSATLSGITVDGLGLGNSNYRYNGVSYRNAGGTVSNCVVTGVRDTPFSGAQHGVAIYGFNDDGVTRTVQVLDTTVIDFQKTAIALGGADMVAVVRGCAITGVGGTDITAQNGIQVAYGATGTIENNVVSGISYTPATWTATAIMLYNAGTGSSVSGNIVSGQTAIYAQGTPNVSITGNTMENADGLTDWAVFIYLSDNAVFSGNTLANANTSGLDVYQANDALVEDNTFTSNGYAVAVSESSLDAEIHNNTFDGNTDTVIVDATSTASAVRNYWGEEEPDFTAEIDGVAAFSPWWADAEMTELRYSDDPVVDGDLTIDPGTTVVVPGTMTVSAGATITVNNGTLQADSYDLEAGAALVVIDGELELTGQNGQPTTVAGSFTIFDSWGSIYFNADTELSGDTVALVSHLVFSNSVTLTVSGSLVLDGCVLEGEFAGDSYAVSVSNSATLRMARNEVLDCSSFAMNAGDAVIKDNFFANGLAIGADADGAEVFHNVFADVADLVDGGTNTVLAADGWGNVSTNDATLNNLGLNLTGADANGDIYIQPGDAVSATLDLDSLNVPVSGLDALLGFNTRFLGDTGTVSVVGGAAPWTFGIYENLDLGDGGFYGQIDKSIGVDLTAPIDGTTNDATVLSLGFTSTSEEGVTKVFFRPAVSGDVPADTRLASAPSGSPVYVSPFTMNSGYITVDGTAPQTESFMGFQAQEGGDVDVFDPAVLTQQGTVHIAIDATDELSGLAGATLTIEHQTEAAALVPTLITTHTNGEMATSYNWAVAVDAATPNGVYDVELVVSDRSGNTTTNTATLEVNKTQIGVSIELLGAVAAPFNRDVTLVMTDAAGDVVETRVETVGFTGGVGTVSMTQIPDGVEAISADTDWTLRTKEAVVYDADGQASVSVALTGGDITGDNKIDMLDFSRMRYFYNLETPEADVNGDGWSNVNDYGLIKYNWYLTGDAE